MRSRQFKGVATVCADITELALSLLAWLLIDCVVPAMLLPLLTSLLGFYKLWASLNLHWHN